MLGGENDIIASGRYVGGDNDGYYFYHQDCRNSTTTILNSEGKEVQSYRYGNFGETESRGSEDFSNEICYTGGIYDSSTGLYYLNARYYSLMTSRFITQDPAQDGMNWYVYCGNNPINNIDPSGLSAKTLQGKYNTNRKFPTPRKTDALKIKIKKNKVTIQWYCNFSGASQKKRTTIMNAIKKKWFGSFTVKKIKKVKVEVKISDKSGGKFEMFQKYSSVVVYKNAGVSNVRWPWGCWSRAEPGNIFLYAGDNRAANGSKHRYTSAQYNVVAAHEFGHILGILDGYNDSSTKNINSIMCDQWGNRNKISLKNRKATGRDIGKALDAYKSNSAQGWK